MPPIAKNPMSWLSISCCAHRSRNIDVGIDAIRVRAVPRQPCPRVHGSREPPAESTSPTSRSFLRWACIASSASQSVRAALQDEPSRSLPSARPTSMARDAPNEIPALPNRLVLDGNLRRAFIYAVRSSPGVQRASPAVEFVAFQLEAGVDRGVCVCRLLCRGGFPYALGVRVPRR